MNGLQFFASIFQSIISLAWPAALVACVWLFRDKLVELLPLFRVKHKESALLDDLRALGNAAAHNQSDPTEEDALKFRDLAERLIRQFDIGTGAAQMPPPGSIPPGG